MIIVPNDSSSSETRKGAVDVKVGETYSLVQSHNGPPSYLDCTATSSSTITSVSTLGTGRHSTIPNIKPTNFVNLNRANEAIKGSWLIDPALCFPPSFLPPPPPTNEARSNLSLESKNGAIDADVFLVPTSHSNKNTSNVIFIVTQSNNGSVKTRLHDTKSMNGQVRLAVNLFTRSSNGSIHVQLPRSFRGPIRIKNNNGSTRFSPEMEAHLTIFSELDHMHRSFLGDFNPSMFDVGAPWVGDELSIESKNGSVNVSFDDEPRHQSFFSKLLAELSL